MCSVTVIWNYIVDAFTRQAGNSEASQRTTHVARTYPLSPRAAEGTNLGPSGRSTTSSVRPPLITILRAADHRILAAYGWAPLELLLMLLPNLQSLSANTRLGVRYPRGAILEHEALARKERRPSVAGVPGIGATIKLTPSIILCAKPILAGWQAGYGDGNYPGCGRLAALSATLWSGCSPSPRAIVC